MVIPAADPATISTIAKYVQDGKCILFLGAAVHCPPPDGSRYAYPEAERPPLGSALSQHLAEVSGLAGRYPNEPPTNLQRVSLDYEIELGRMKLVEEIEQAVHEGKRPSPVVRALAEMDFPIVITTNYDRLFEKALAQFDKNPVHSIYKRNEGTQPQPTDDYPGVAPTPKKPFIIKIHGDIQTPDSIVITDEDYIQFVMRMSEHGQYDPIPETFSYHFRRWPTLFIGYSLMDYNLRLLFKTMRWNIDMSRIPATYSVDRSPDPLIFDIWHNRRGYVNFIAQDVWAFVPDLYRRVIGKDMPE